jgi:protein involved in polysaccharide export with SLBB domain
MGGPSGPSAPGTGPTGPYGPSAPGTGQDLSGQAQYYLQKIGPGLAPSQGQQTSPAAPTPGQLSPQAPTLQAPQPGQPQTGIEAPKAEPIGEQAEALSDMERQASMNGLNVAYFGYNFFRKPPSSFLPVTSIPVGPDYLIGPGDTIRIIIWGSVQGEYSVTVDRNGQIQIPKIGVVQVSSLTFKQLREVLDREFSRQFNNFQMNVTLDNLRTIRVYVVGQARSPGSYEVSSLSTLINAIFTSGGPNKTGSLRNIEVRRGGRVIIHFDLYDLLLRGDKSKDIRLMPEDVIFIPVAAERVGIGGPVKVPAIYELKRERTLTDMIRLAGGLEPVTFKSRVQILRIKDRKEMILIEDDMEKFLTGQLPDVILSDGDLIKVFPVPSSDIKMVRITGAVQNPGSFGYRAGMRLKDLILFAGGFVMQTNLDEAEITRVTVTPQGPQTDRIYVSLRRALAGNPRDNILLKPNDYLFVRNVPDWDLYKTVMLAGEVRFPGTYAIKKGETLSSLLARSGGFSDTAYALGTVFIRPSVKAIQKQQLDLALNRMEAQAAAIAAEKTAGALDDKDAKQAGAFYQQQQKIIAKMRTVEPLGRVVIRLDDPERLRGTPNDIGLQEGDQITVPPIQQTVNVVGAVFNPTALVYTKQRTVQEYITMAGGLTNIGDEKEVYIVKVNGSAVSRSGFNFLGSGWDGTKYSYSFGGMKSLRLDPGDTIVVPEQVEKIAWLKEIKDIATIIGQIALTAGVVLVGLKK